MLVLPPFPPKLPAPKFWHWSRREEIHYFVRVDSYRRSIAGVIEFFVDLDGEKLFGEVDVGSEALKVACLLPRVWAFPDGVYAFGPESMELLFALRSSVGASAIIAGP